MSGRVNDVRVSPHFTLREFQCSCCGRVMLAPSLLCLLEELRELRGRAVVLTSGYRCREHNEKVGGAPRSLHMAGRAADIAVPRDEQPALAEIARALGAVEVIPGGAKGYLHVAV